MNLFRTLFGPRTSDTNVLPAIPVTGSPPPEELFTDRTPPGQESPEAPEKDTPIAAFLRKDYLGIGMHDGFEYHNQDQLQAGRRRIRAEFLTLLDQVILERRELRRWLQDRMVDVAPLSDEMWRKLRISEEEMNHVLELLERQKTLAIEEEGWLMQALHAYQQGFLKGVQDRLESEDMMTRLQLL